MILVINPQLMTIPLSSKRQIVKLKLNFLSREKKTPQKRIQFMFFTTLFFIHFQLKVNNNKAAQKIVSLSH